MSDIKIHVFHTGTVCVSPYLPFGGDDCSPMKAAGLTTKKKDRIWVPVSAYYIEHPKGKLLFDCGWDRSMSPAGKLDKKAQIASLGSKMLYHTNQGVVPIGETVSEQLLDLGVCTRELDYVLLSHLDCDHANGLPLVKDAKHILVSAEELECTKKNSFIIKTRYQEKWWKDIDFEFPVWNGTEGPIEKSYDLFGDGSVKLILIPGHSDGQCALKITNDSGKYVLLFADGGYATKSWKEMITSGIAMDKEAQKKSLQWIREQCMSADCLEALANHDADVKPHTITL